MTTVCRKRALLHVLLLLFVTIIEAQPMPQGIVFERLKANDQLPANEISHIFQDYTGFIWIGTQNGLYRFDGYRMKQYRNTPAQPHVLASNVVSFISEDHQNQLWIGTRKGVTRMDATREGSYEYHFRDFGNSDVVNRILVTHSGQVWVGTEGGLYRYEAECDTFQLLCDQRKNSKVPHCSVTSLIEDKQGYVWIGTWDKGLFRYNPKKDTYYEMPLFNDLNSAQAVFEDHNGHLWVGTWGRGIYCLLNPHDTNRPLRFFHYTHVETQGALLSDIVWDLNEDYYTGLLWIGTSKGLSFMPLSEKKGQPDDSMESIFPLPVSLMPEPDFFAHGVNSFFCDQRGRMWMNAYERGIVSTSTRPSNFAPHALSHEMQASEHISAMAYDRNGGLIVGTSHTGLLMDRENSIVPLPSKANAILPLPSGELLVGTQRNGLITIANRNIIRQQDRNNTPWLADNCIFALAQDAEGNLLAGTWRGLSVQYTNGHGLHLEGKNLQGLEMAQVADIGLSPDGTIWLATQESGIIRLQGSVRKPRSIRKNSYTTLLDTDFQVLNIYRILVDHLSRVWACSQESGLMLYDRERDGFVNVGDNYGIPDDDMYSLEETADGHLWMSSRHHLIRLLVTADGKVAELRFFDRKNVIGSDYFGAGFSAVSPTGELCFSGSYAYTTFNGNDIPDVRDDTPALITDVKLFNTSLGHFGHEITLRPHQHDLSIEFSSMDFDNCESVRYAYMLDGLDREWHYTDVAQSQVSYSQLPAGTYTFRLRCTNEGGSWSQEEQRLVIHVLAPIYQRWYAYLLYLLIIGALLYMLFRYMQERERHRLELQLAHMERQRALNQLEEYKQKTYEKVREDLFADICGISLSHTDEDFVRQCLACMQRHISDTEFDLPRFADAMCMSKSTLYKKLRSTTGLSTSAFIRTVRMKSASELLRQHPDVRIADVAYAVGYSDPKYFSSCFKKDFGMLPSEYATQKHNVKK
ncbi:MAG: helix-turn-helix domain-containing protein [Bacteroidaceae bacterium]|nr:helix-turn-helix domain-containing protein [Bacteroidaceae bacterium]